MRRLLWDLPVKAIGWIIIAVIAVLTCPLWIPMGLFVFFFFCVDKALGGGDW